MEAQEEDWVFYCFNLLAIHFYMNCFRIEIVFTLTGSKPDLIQWALSPSKGLAVSFYIKCNKIQLKKTFPTISVIKRKEEVLKIFLTALQCSQPHANALSIWTGCFCYLLSVCCPCKKTSLKRSLKSKDLTDFFHDSLYVDNLDI